MLFNVEYDSGDEVNGYLVPDGFTARGHVRVVHRGQVIAVFETPEERPSLVAGARHGTGLCGFTIDRGLIPDLVNNTDFEIYDHETGCLVYRRYKPEMISRKIVRFETQLLPLWPLDDCLVPFFQYFGKGVDRYGRESVTQMLLLQNVSSLLISGRIQFKNYAVYLDQGYECFGIIQSPHDECAERLLVLRNAAKFGSQLLGERDMKRLEPAIRFAQALPLDQPKQLGWMIADMPGDVASLLANPLCRLLTTANPDDMPGPSAIAGALDVLSGFSLVGFRDTAQEFNLALGEWLDLDVRHFPVLPPLRELSPLGEFLRMTKAADAILEKDLELYHHISEALKPLQSANPASLGTIEGRAAMLSR